MSDLLAVSTVPEAECREVIASRLPVHSWPQSQLEIVAVDAFSGERTIFKRDSGVELVDAVTASCALPYVYPPATINQHLYIDGGCYSIANLDLATGFDKILVLQPDVPPFPFLETLDEQRERLQREGAQIEVITPDEAMRLIPPCEASPPIWDESRTGARWLVWLLCGNKLQSRPKPLPG